MAAVLCSLAFCMAEAHGETREGAIENARAMRDVMGAYESQRWAEAASLGEVVLGRVPDHIGLLRIVGASFAKLSEFERAEPFLARLSELLPEDAENAVNLCIVRKALQREDALETCRKAQTRMPNHPEVAFYVGTLAEKAGLKKEAHDAYLQAYRLIPDNLTFLTSVTSIDFESKNYEEILELYDVALEHGLERDILDLNAILAANHLGVYEKAVALADHCLEKYGNHEALVGKAEALYGLGRYDAAREIVEKAREFYSSPGLPAANRLLYTDARLRLLRDDVSALPILQSIQNEKLVRKRPYFQADLMNAYLISGKLDEAEGIALQLGQSPRESYRIISKYAGVLIDLKRLCPGGVTLACLEKTEQKPLLRHAIYQWELLGRQYPGEGSMTAVSEKGWPPSLENDILALMQYLENRAAKNNGCGCEMMQKRTPLSLPVLIFLVLFGGCLKMSRGWRRKSS